MRTQVIFIIIAVTILSCRQKNSDPTKPHIQIQTEKGDIEIEL